MSIVSRFIINALIPSFIFIANTVTAAEGAYIGRAYDHKTDELLYTEYHYPTPFNNLAPEQEIVYYVNKDNQLMVKKNLDFHNGLQQPTFSTYDYRFQSSDGISFQEDRLLAFVQPGPDKKRHDRLIEISSPLVIDAGFDHFVRQQWQELLAGESRYFYFASSIEQRLIKFMLRRASQTEETQQFIMVLANPIARLLLAPIKLTYDTRTKRLLRYQGISNIRSQSDGFEKVRIEYQWLQQMPPQSQWLP